MNDWRYRVRAFLTALVFGLGGILPAAGCPGGCGPCFQCAGLGGVMAVLVAMKTARRKPQNERKQGAVETDH